MRKTAVVLCILLVGTLPLSAVDLRVTGGETMGIPFWLSADLGLIMGREQGDDFKGIKVSGEIGIGGTKLFLGYYTSTQQEFIRSTFSIGPALMRTFGSPLLADDWRTFAGIEAQYALLAFLPITIRLGVFSWIDEFHPQFTFAFGIGL